MSKISDTNIETFSSLLQMSPPFLQDTHTLDTHISWSPDPEKAACATRWDLDLSADRSIEL